MTASTPATPATPAVGRLIAGFMIGGITVFAIVAWVLVQRSGPMGDPATADVLRMAWPPVALAAVAAAIVLWRARVTPLLARSTATDPTDPDTDDLTPTPSQAGPPPPVAPREVSHGRAIEVVTLQKNGREIQVTGKALVEDQEGGLLLLERDGALWLASAEEVMRRRS